MPLKQTTLLMTQYGHKIIDGTLSDEELQSLMNTPFSRSPGYIDPAYVSESNHSSKNSIDDFVTTIAPRLSPEILHQTTRRMIHLAPKGDKNTFMRTSTIEKAFLAYEMLHYPKKAEEHLHSERMQEEFPTENAIHNLKQVILGPMKLLYQKGIPYKEELILPTQEKNATATSDKTTPPVFLTATYFKTGLYGAIATVCMAAVFIWMPPAAFGILAMGLSLSALPIAFGVFQGIAEWAQNKLKSEKMSAPKQPSQEEKIPEVSQALSKIGMRSTAKIRQQNPDNMALEKNDPDTLLREVKANSDAKALPNRGSQSDTPGKFL